MTFIKHHLACPQCGGSDPVSLNEDGSAKCFSCETYLLNYNKELTGEIVTEKETDTTALHGGDYVALTDRRISEATAKKYGVKSVLSSNGEIVQHVNLIGMFSLRRRYILKISDFSEYVFIFENKYIEQI